MLTKKQVEDAGYTVLPEGAWLRIEPEMMPHDWLFLCGHFGVDPSCKEVILCVCGVKEINDESMD